MAGIQEDLSLRILSLEKELRAALERNEQTFRYKWVRGKAKFTEEVLKEHRILRLPLPSYILHSSFLVTATAR